MAFRRRKGGMRRKSWVQRQEHFWTSSVADRTAVIAGNLLTFPVVTGADWSVRIGFATATVARVRGSVSVTPTGATGAAGGAVFAAALVLDQDEAVPSLALAATYVEEDILWTACGAINGNSVPDAQNLFHREIDIRVRRKLKPEDQLLVVVQMQGQAGLVSGVLRALVVTK